MMINPSNWTMFLMCWPCFLVLRGGRGSRKVFAFLQFPATPLVIMRAGGGGGGGGGGLGTRLISENR